MCSPGQRVLAPPEAPFPQGLKWRLLKQEERISFQAEGKLRAKALDPLHLAGCMLYWAEGTKSRNTLELANSDPDLVAFFLEFLRRCFDIDDERIRLRITAHLDHERTVTEIQTKWLEHLDLPGSCLIKPVVVEPKKTKAGRHNRLPIGVCSLRLTRSTQILQHIYGAIQEYASFSNPNWLDGPRSKGPSHL